MRAPGCFVELVDLRNPWVADLTILRRRRFMRVLRLSRHRVLMIGRLSPRRD